MRTSGVTVTTTAAPIANSASSGGNTPTQPTRRLMPPLRSLASSALRPTAPRGRAGADGSSLRRRPRLGLPA
ncbi:MAG: hypothetical protein P8Z81_11305, partial [Deinococcales bacterium]